MGNELSVAITEKESSSLVFREKNGSKIEAGISGMQGFRKEMEDKHIHTTMPSAPDHLFFGVLDGHGGSGCAIYVSGTNPRRNLEEDKCLTEILEETDEWVQYLRTGKSDGTGKNIKLLESALISAFVLMDNHMRMYLRMNPLMVETFGGCTGVIVMITPEYIVCANAGDSRATMSKINKPIAIPLSSDHKPTNFEEKIRIEAAGGSVVNKRVDDNLAVSRGFGDFEFKMDKSKGPEGQKVSCIPEFKICTRCTDDEWIILACDGLWDVCSNERAIELVREIGDSGSNTIVNIAEKMCDKALELDSNDNISVIVVKLSNYKNHLIESPNPTTTTTTTNTTTNTTPTPTPIVPTVFRPGSAVAHLNNELKHFKPPPAVAHLNTESTRPKPGSVKAFLESKKVVNVIEAETKSKSETEKPRITVIPGSVKAFLEAKKAESKQPPSVPVPAPGPVPGPGPALAPVHLEAIKAGEIKSENSQIRVRPGSAVDYLRNKKS